MRVFASKQATGNHNNQLAGSGADSRTGSEHIPKVLQYIQACCKRNLYREDCQEKNVQTNVRKVLKHVAQHKLQHITYTAAK